MKKKRLFKGLGLFGCIAFGVVVLSSCTANFCSNMDKANIMYSYDTGSTTYVSSETDAYQRAKIKHKYNDHLYAYQDFEKDFKGDDNKMITTVEATAITNGILCPSDEFWFRFDDKVLDYAITAHNIKENVEYKKETLTVEQIVKKDDKGNVSGLLFDYGCVKYLSSDEKTLWTYWDEINENIGRESKYQHYANSDFVTLYKNAVNTKVNNVRSCITLENGVFGNFGYNHNKVNVESKNWKYAWGRGFLEGLLVYPIAYMTECFSHAFGMGGFGQLGAILLVTFIVRTLILLVSFKSTIAQQKMQMLQPELSKIQAKYPNSNTNQAQKQKLAQEQMALYKKNKINPFGQLLVLVVQFPLFIAVWGAMQGSAALATDAVWNLHLSSSILDTLKNTSNLPSNVNGWWTALILFLVMSISQFLSMKLPQWMAKAREKKMPKLHANPAANKTQNTMKWVGYIMLVMIIFMGLTLPAGMGVYWLAGALFSIVQTVITQMILNGTFKNMGYAIKKMFKKNNIKEGDK